MVGPEKTKDDKYNLEKISQDRGPHIPQEVEDLALECCDELYDAGGQD